MRTLQANRSWYKLPSTWEAGQFVHTGRDHLEPFNEEAMAPAFHWQMGIDRLRLRKMW
jgi:hypothetical protein